MLTELTIRNYALIDNLTIEFGPGLNVLTGETGAGKSIIIGALSLVLGERADADVVRTGESEVQVQARFEDISSQATEALNELGLFTTDGILLLRRRHDRSGRSFAYANDSGITISALRRLGDCLVDLHGQHQHQVLLRPETHLQTLDFFGRLIGPRDKYEQGFSRLQKLRQELAALEQELAAKRQRRDLTEYQARELASARVQPGELAQLEQEHRLLASSEKRYTLAREVENLISEREGSAQELISAIGRKLTELCGLDSSLSPARDGIATVEATLADLWREIVSYRENIQFSPERMEEVNARLFLLQKLEQKYQVPADRLPELESRLNAELGSLELDQSRFEELHREIARLERDLLNQAQNLSRSRKQAARKLEAKLEPEFAALGLEKARLVVNITGPESPGPNSLTPSGLDQVEFLFSANPGEELRPLRKVASGGELSRIMLSLKSVLSGVALVPTMVFDEVDVGIGGRVAEAVGRRLARLGRTQQVVCITHLPQIARFADRHFLVAKETKKGRTRTTIERLDDAGRVSELARMSAGTEVTETSLAHAREMLKRT